jgi:hypothetical protein
VLCVVCRVSCVVCLVSCVVCRVLCVVCRVLCVVCCVSCVVCRVFCVVCSVSLPVAGPLSLPALADFQVLLSYNGHFLLLTVLCCCLLLALCGCQLLHICKCLPAIMAISCCFGLGCRLPFLPKSCQNFSEQLVFDTTFRHRFRQILVCRLYLHRIIATVNPSASTTTVRSQGYLR